MKSNKKKLVMAFGGIAVVAAGIGSIVAINSAKKTNDFDKAATGSEIVTEAISDNYGAVVTPTEATGEAITEAPISETSDSVGGMLDYTNCADAYYLELGLRENAIQAYNWQFEQQYNDGEIAVNESKSIAFADVTGDGEPEMFIVCSEDDDHLYAGLKGYTVDKDSRAQEIFYADVDICAGGGAYYMLFKKSGSDALYLYSQMNAAEISGELSRLYFENGMLHNKNIMWFHTNEGAKKSYFVNDLDVTEDEYKQAQRDFFSDVDEILLYNRDFDYLEPDIVQHLNAVSKTGLSLGEVRRMLSVNSENKSALPFTAPISFSAVYNTDEKKFTDVLLKADGSFEGTYTLFDETESGDGYNVTTYKCVFVGNFSDIEKVSDGKFKMKLDVCKAVENTENEMIEGNIRYVPTNAVGVDDGKEFEIYAPSTPVSELPEGLVSKIEGLEENGILDSWVLYNVDSDIVFLGF